MGYRAAMMKWAPLVAVSVGVYRFHLSKNTLDNLWALCNSVFTCSSHVCGGPGCDLGGCALLTCCIHVCTSDVSCVYHSAASGSVLPLNGSIDCTNSLLNVFRSRWFHQVHRCPLSSHVAHAWQCKVGRSWSLAPDVCARECTVASLKVNNLAAISVK